MPDYSKDREEGERDFKNFVDQIKAVNGKMMMTVEIEPGNPSVFVPFNMSELNKLSKVINNSDLDENLKKRILRASIVCRHELEKAIWR